VEQVHRYGSFVTTHALEQAPSTPSANGLDSRAFAADAGTAVVLHPSLEKECAVVRGVGSDQEALDAEVHANDTTLGFRLNDLNLMGETQIPDFSDPLDLGILPATFRDIRVTQLCELP
jgi:hypothetical protein